MLKIDLNPKVNDPFTKQLGFRYPEDKYSSMFRVQYMTYDGLMRYLITEGDSPFRKQYLTATTEEELKRSDRRHRWLYVSELRNQMTLELMEQIGKHPVLENYLVGQPCEVVWSGDIGVREKRWVEIVADAIKRLSHPD